MRLWISLISALALPACGDREGADPAPGHAPAPAQRAPKPADPLAPPADLRAPPADAETGEGGLRSKRLRDGTGRDRPQPHDRVQVHYTTWTLDGKVFASSHRRGAPAAFRVGDVSPGWAQGLGLMVEGEKRRLWIPAALAGESAGAPVVMDVELRQLSRGKAPLPPPEDLTEPPVDVATTDSGIRHRLLRGEPGGVKPDPHDRVRVSYTGWDSQGTMIESSTVRGDSVVLELDHGFPGFQEALASMAQGETRRFWIPEAQAFKTYPGTTRGDVVYDIEVREVIEMPDPPAVPKDVAGPPKGAKRTASGLAYVVLREGTGQMKPGPRTKVEAHFSYWNTRGQLQGSSISEDQPRRLGVDRVSKGLGEGLQMMVVGEKRRFWIPEDIGPKSVANPSPGMLVYDVDLLAIYKKKIKVEWVDWDAIKPRAPRTAQERLSSSKQSPP